jgi:hypothetical protein
METAHKTPDHNHHHHKINSSSSRSVTPKAQNTHSETHPANTAPHKLDPLLLPSSPLDLLAIDIVDIFLNHALLQALLHGQVQTAAGCRHKASP